MTQETNTDSTVAKIARIAAWCNFLAGVCLLTSNLLAKFRDGPLPNPVDPTQAWPVVNKWHPLWKLTLYAEGVLYSIAAILLYILQSTVLKSKIGSAAQASIAVAGFFFAYSTFFTPASLYTLDMMNLDVLGHYGSNIGITCFMTGSALGFTGLSLTPAVTWDLKEFRLFSDHNFAIVLPYGPKIGVAFFVLGAWTIGVGQIWSGYFLSLEKDAQVKLLVSNWAAHGGGDCSIIGAIFLTLGGATFLLLDYFPNTSCTDYKMGGLQQEDLINKSRDEPNIGDAGDIDSSRTDPYHRVI